MKSLMSHFSSAMATMNVIDLDNALELAARDGHNRTVKWLLEAGADIHADNDEALRTAAWWGRTSTVQVLLENGADVHAKKDQSMRWAMDDNHPETARIIEEWMSKHPGQGALQPS